ncbi:hypothetical protein QQF64_013928 [Cirrhinus molitorella]|uniref:Uncharacterized protein n=1 Tax=Cirrhinus molitorella TaxID=172907 RepID=A0ABR3LW48_9TELE
MHPISPPSGLNVSPFVSYEILTGVSCVYEKAVGPLGPGTPHATCLMKGTALPLPIRTQWQCVCEVRSLLAAERAVFLCSATAGLRQSEGTQPVTNSQHCCQLCDMGTTRPALNHVSNRPSLAEVPDTMHSSDPSRCENHTKKTQDQNSRYGSVRTHRYRPSECSTASPTRGTESLTAGTRGGRQLRGTLSHVVRGHGISPQAVRQLLCPHKDGLFVTAKLRRGSEKHRAKERERMKEKDRAASTPLESSGSDLTLTFVTSPTQFIPHAAGLVMLGELFCQVQEDKSPPCQGSRGHSCSSAVGP